MKQWFVDLWDGFIEWLKDSGEHALLEIKDLSLDIFELFLDGAMLGLSLIAPPDVLTTSMQTLFSAIPPSVLFLLSQTGISEGLSIYGSAVMFRMARKIYTLGAW